MKKQLYIITIILLSIILMSCTGNRKLSKNEDFDSFSKKFYSDSLFHYKRIHFPLEIVEYLGNLKRLSEDEYHSNIETKQFTRKTLPRMIKSFSKYPEIYERMLDTTATGIDEKIYLPNSGYSETRSFILDGKKWYLRHVNIMNL